MTRVLALLLITAACSSDDRPGDMVLGIYKFVDAEQCLLHLPAERIPPPAAELEGQLGTCKRPATADERVLVRGADRLEVVVDYDGLAFDDSEQVATPTSSIRVDGLPQSLAVPFAELVIGNRRGFRGPLTVPASVGDRLTISVEATTGYASPAQSFALQAPRPAIEIEGCPEAGCRRTAAVGEVLVRIRVPARIARTATLTQRLDGMLLPGATPVELSLDRGGSFERVFPVAVPASEKTWTLIAELDEREVVGPPIRLERPAIATELLCGAGCTPTANARTGIRITAPRGIRPATALVTVLVAGVPQLIDGPKALTSEDATTDTVSGVLELTMPDQPGADLRIDASVAGFPADVLLTTIASTVARATVNSP